MTTPNEYRPRVSVVMSVYNGETDLEKTIDSILGQTFSEFEFIVVDDGSKDSSSSILDDYAARDPRMVVVKQNNQGLTSALVAGCRLAKGEFIARQDVGDLSRPQRFERQVDYLECHPDVVAVGSGHIRVGPGGEFLGESTRDLSPEAVTNAFLNDGVSISHTVAMFRRKAFMQVGGYRTEFRFAQDTDLWYRMCRVGKLGEISEVLFEWGLDVDGVSATNRERQLRLADLAHLAHQRVIEGASECEVLEQAQKTSWDSDSERPNTQNRQSEGDAEFFIGSQLFALGDPRCRSYFRRALARRPWRLRAWIKLMLSYLP